MRLQALCLKKNQLVKLADIRYCPIGTNVCNTTGWSFDGSFLVICPTASMSDRHLCLLFHSVIYDVTIIFIEWFILSYIFKGFMSNRQDQGKLQDTIIVTTCILFIISVICVIYCASHLVFLKIDHRSTQLYWYCS